MKAKDLMVGDWIELKFYHPDGVDIRHRQLKTIDIYNNIDCEPITLIPRMLTDNGFKPVSTAVSATPIYWEYHDGDVQMSLHPNTRTLDKGFFVAIAHGKIASYTGIIHYVNELQQALHVCKTNIDINI